MNRVTEQTIYLVRHGETEWNREGRLQGQRDSRLTAQGRQQARRVGDLLKDLIEEPAQCAMVVSPLKRTRRTADIIYQALGLDPSTRLYDSLLMEKKYGRWEGMTPDEIGDADPEDWRRYVADRWNVQPPGGESYEMLAHRARRWFTTVENLPCLIVVGHGAFGRVLRGIYSGLPPDETIALDAPQDATFRLSHGVVTRFDA